MSQHVKEKTFKVGRSPYRKKNSKKNQYLETVDIDDFD